MPQRGLHEKLAVVDWRLAWFGSLSILSYSSSTEWMMRFADSLFVAKLVQVTGTAHFIRQADWEQERNERRQRLAAALLGGGRRCRQAPPVGVTPHPVPGLRRRATDCQVGLERCISLVRPVPRLRLGGGVLSPKGADRFSCPDGSRAAVRQATRPLLCR